MTNEIAVRIDGAIERALTAQTIGGKMESALALADAVCEIREALKADGVLDKVMALQGSPIGFRTDKPYDRAIVADAVIEAAMHGLRLVGNEFNVIGGRMYITKEGMARKLNSISGLRWSISAGMPVAKDGGAMVPMTIEWQTGGEKSKREITFPVKMSTGMGADALIGKATRKARAWLYQTVSGQELPDGEADDAITVAIIPPAGNLLPEIKAN